jgi:hypothetical protein
VQSLHTEQNKVSYYYIEVLLGQGANAHIGLNKTLQVQKHTKYIVSPSSLY